MYLWTVIGIAFIFIMTTLGSGLIFLMKSPKIKVDFFNGMAAGVMFAAAIWSLLIPAIEQLRNPASWIIPSLGVISGGIVLYLFDLIKPLDKENKLFMAVTIHNIPEGLAVGLSYGMAIYYNDYTLLALAIGLAFGIGVQNTIEGFAVTMPLKEKYGVKKSFYLGTLSGAVEPIMALLGVLLSIYINSIMPFLLSLAAGTMIYVIADELIPEAQSKNGVWGVMIGFIFMMILDIAL